jgi:predicted  nucleic acid-binding Zn-ribbon protein
VAALWLLAGAGASAAAEADPPISPPPVELDQLLKLPDSFDLENPRYGGATRSEWRSRFAEAREALEEARAALEAAQHELEELAGEKAGWQMSAPGVQVTNAENSPVSYELRQEIRRQRDEIERFERRLQELGIEAKLAGVPDEWLATAEDARPQTEP